MGAPIIQPKRIHVYGSPAPALVDDDIFEIASSMAWHLSPDGYVRSCSYDRSTVIYLSSLALGQPSSASNPIHYLNDNKLDCRRRNLAVVTPSQLMGTKRLHKNNTSGYKGVSWSKAVRKWRAYISPQGKCITLGYFHDKLDAAKAYDAAAVKYFGPTARTNASMALQPEKTPTAHAPSTRFARS